ncbi:PREDICTED: putative fatty acyl-CoA reductase CG8306 isoform X2 [Nicrophorus vespilloides]|uniref:Fatty acyl-CoA reductase n=1 Tax=Nicrophorus vespilloides TaxID=110193 RepID=A0ABM1N1G3_NICVS|nr:PREDICTED: putative fatty acyl-CoA reductase CG8306 isoform X2 [Nicrophorus vespilloides]
MRKSVGSKETCQCLKICLDNKNIKCFMYVSTVYSYARRSCSRIEEKIYEPILKPETLLDMSNGLTNDELDEFENTLMKDWPNTYTFTKNVTEYYCDTFKDQMSIGIFRPGTVTSAISEPFPTWVKSKAGILGAIILLGTKLVPSYYVDKKALSHCVPVDMTVNALITSTYDVISNKSKDTKIYNYTSNNNPITFYDGFMIATKNKCISLITYNYYWNAIKMFLLMYLPFVNQSIYDCMRKSITS